MCRVPSTLGFSSYRLGVPSATTTPSGGSPGGGIVTGAAITVNATTTTTMVTVTTTAPAEEVPEEVETTTKPIEYKDLDIKAVPPYLPITIIVVLALVGVYAEERGQHEDMYTYRN